MASGTPWGWIAGGVGVVGLWWWSSRGSAKASSSPRNAASGLASPIALPGSVAPLQYYQYTVQSTGVEFKPNNTFSPKAPVLTDATGGYLGATASYFEIENGTGGLFRQEWELAYAREHYGKVPEQVRSRWNAQKSLFDDRFASMTQQHPNDFGPAPDTYSKAANLVFRPEHTLGYSIQLNVPISPTYNKLHAQGFGYRPWGWYFTDEFGRPYEGWGASGFDVLTFVSQVSNAVLPWIPGYGTAANIVIQTTIAVAQGKSTKEIALAAARAALPGGAAFAFDLGVGIVLEGKDPKDAVIHAAITELDKKYPGAKLAFEQGQSMAKQYAKPNPQNVNGLSFGGVFG